MFKFKATKVRNVCRLNENAKHIFSYKYFDVFTKSSTVHTHIYIYTSIHTHTHTHTHTHIYIYIYIYIHMDTHMYIYKHI